MGDISEGPVLAGALRGRSVLAKLLELISREPGEPEPLFLDFAGIEVATASFLRESVLEFRDTVRRRRSNFYPLVANANEVVAEELAVLLAPHREVLMLCTLNDDGKPLDPHLVGDLEPKQRLTFDLVQRRGETDAGELMRIHRESADVRQTAWNNRLASLARLGLVLELRHGRAKRYRPLFAES